MLKFPVLFFTDFVRKKLVKGKKDFLSLMLQLRGLLWMVTCTEKGHYCAKSPSFPFCNDMLPNQAKTKQEYTFKQFKKFGIHKATIYRWLKKIEQNGNCDQKTGSGTGK